MLEITVRIGIKDPKDLKKEMFNEFAIYKALQSFGPFSDLDLMVANIETGRVVMTPGFDEEE